jgi:hypothetical protein
MGRNGFFGKIWENVRVALPVPLTSITYLGAFAPETAKSAQDVGPEPRPSSSHNFPVLSLEMTPQA